ELLTVQGTCIIRVPSSIPTVPIFGFANLCGFLLARQNRDGLLFFWNHSAEHRHMLQRISTMADRSEISMQREFDVA
ncbi:unnamed protein product, partial [Vitis vinifera]